MTDTLLGLREISDAVDRIKTGLELEIGDSPDDESVAEFIRSKGVDPDALTELALVNGTAIAQRYPNGLFAGVAGFGTGVVVGLELAAQLNQ